MISLPGVIENRILKWKIIAMFMLHITTCTWNNTVRSKFCACAYISFIHCYVLAWDSLGIMTPNWHTQFTQLVYDDISEIITFLNTHFSLKITIELWSPNYSLLSSQHIAIHICIHAGASVPSCHESYIVVLIIPM